jgi:phosphoribosylformylglycinamidine synthase II/phosphoribosylformylglycinamidine synthase I
MEILKVIRVEVWARQNGGTALANTWVQTARQLGLTSVTGAHLARIFFINGTLTPDEIQQLSHELLADPVTEDFAILPIDQAVPSLQADHTIEVTRLPGVTDPAAENLRRAAHLLGMTGVQHVATGERYLLQGRISGDDLHRLAATILSNPVIQRFEIDRPISPPFVPCEPAHTTVDVIALREADADTLQTISAARCLSLNLAEMEAVQAYFRQEGRDPTDIELEMLAQTWSEHCVHKTFKAVVDYTGPLPGGGANGELVQQHIDGLLKTYIQGATERVKKAWVRSAFVDNAGIIAFDHQWDLAFKLETHNHPSALEPFGGANTGVGGVVRDILGVSARPIANTDVLCFGPQDLPETDLPAGTLHPRRIAEGVVQGVEDYGNKMGIPTVNGAILYHPGYTANPLVFCGCLGILPHGSHPAEPQPGDLIVVIGGRTGRDGLHGATFSSMEMDHTTGETSGSAVQIGHPINEKQVLEVVLRARDERLYHAITDCGAGGLSSAVGEMSAEIGASVQLKTVPLKYPGLRPWEIWLSEAQERMVLAVPPHNWPRLQAICAGQDVEAVCLGELESTGRFRLHYGEHMVADLSVGFIHNGIPRRHLTAEWSAPPSAPALECDEPADLSAALLDLLAHPNIRSKESVVRRYDHEVQGGTAVKPLVGVGDHGPGDAAVLVPLDVQRTAHDQAGVTKALALGAGIAPAYTEFDPYAMAWAAVDEAMRNIVAVGADPDQVALLDNFCWGNSVLPDRLGGLVRCVQGCYDAAIAYGAPYISGKDSLNNEYLDRQGQRCTIPGTLLISALGIVPDVNQTVTMDLKWAGSRLYVVGETRDELGGSHYALVRNTQGGVVPQPVPDVLERLRALHRAVQAGLIQACHDCSEGGLGVAVAEMCIAGRLGVEIDLSCVPGAAGVARDDALLFSETLSRFVVEVRSEDVNAFETLMAKIPHAAIGGVTVRERELRINGRRVPTVAAVLVDDLEQAWRGWLSEREALAKPSRPAPRVNIYPTRPPRVLILHANGTNRDREAAFACERAGAQPDIVHINQLLSGEKSLSDYHMLVVPGGFSYGDDLGAGTLSAMDLRHRLGGDVTRFVESGRPVLGICNGFQTLVKAGLLPGVPFGSNGHRCVTLAPNESGRFECRWVYLQPNLTSPCIFTAGLDDLFYCPVAHGEGRVAVRDQDTLDALQTQGLIALTYVNADGTPAHYPANPNGSVLGIAGLCNAQGNVLGLMPHPEDHLFGWQHPRWHRGESGLPGLRLFENGVKHA